MENKKLQLVKTFVEWVLKDYPLMWVRGPGDVIWYKQNQHNIIWDDNYEYRFFNENQVPQPHPTTYRRTKLIEFMGGKVKAETVEVNEPSGYDPFINRGTTFIKWIDNWTEVTE